MVSLVLENQDWWVIHSSLPWLEHKLYDYFRNEGMLKPTPKERAEQFEQAVDLSIKAFWDKVVDCYPEAIAGDIGPNTLHEFARNVRSAIRVWVDNNVK